MIKSILSRKVARFKKNALTIRRFFDWGGLLILCFFPRSIFISSWRFNSPGPDFTNRLQSPFIILVFYRSLKIRKIGARVRTVLTRSTTCHVLFTCCTHVWRIRSRDQIRSVWGGWLTKLHLGQFFERKNGQRSIQSSLFLFPCVTWGI